MLFLVHKKISLEKEKSEQGGISSFILFRWVTAALVGLLILPVRIYQWIISPWLPKTCRYHPTCSSFAIEALKIHGPIVGLLMGTFRILSCHPWGGQGYDPVPPKGTPFRKLFFRNSNED